MMTKAIITVEFVGVAVSKEEAVKRIHKALGTDKAVLVNRVVVEASQP